VSERVEATFAGVLMAVAATGIALAIVTVPWVTGVLVDRVDSAGLSGLSAPQARILAEEVRAYVTSSDAPALRSTAFGRPAFDVEQAEHLDDVRGVMLGARAVTFVAGVLVAAWLLLRLLRGRRDLTAAATGVAGTVLLGVAGLALLAGLADFDMLFARFHEVFFKPGTWHFDSGDLVIQLFPESFWVAAAGIWAALLVASGVALLAASWAIARGRRSEALRG
jgi:integral membrane protein (TIGR01906 family)